MNPVKALLFLSVALLLVAACGGPKPAPAPKPDTTAAAYCPPESAAACCGSDSTGAVCDTALTPDPTSITAAVPADTAPKPKPAAVAEKPKELPRMWDFGAVTCLPCKTMKEILDPMMAEYKGKVDIRIINVYEEKELTKQFRIVTIPTQVFIDADGKELFRHIGVYPRDSIEAKFKGFGFPLVSGTSTPKPAPATGGT